MNSPTIASPYVADSTLANTHAAATARIHSIDIVRGLVMVLMALDHVRDYFTNASRIDLMDPSQTTLGLYVTRWITHLCAPTFIFLAGVSAQRLSTRVTTAQLATFLFTRGLWLVALEVTVVLAAWSFNLRYTHGVILQVIWAIGMSMIALAALVHLPMRAIGAFAILTIALHNLLDGISPAQLGAWAPLWHILHVRGPVPLGIVGYPLIPWIGVMALGFAMGTLFDRSAQTRRKVLVIAGVAALLAFLVLRFSNVYGDPQPWKMHGTAAATLMSFFDVEKYPPSLLYLLATLGMGWLLLAAAESRAAVGAASRTLQIFGRVPLFFYVLHIVLAHVLAGLLALALGFGAAVITNDFASLPRDWGFDLPAVYAAWVLVLVLLYPACRWFGAIKRRRSDWWLSYL